MPDNGRTNPGPDGQEQSPGEREEDLETSQDGEEDEDLDEDQYDFIEDYIRSHTEKKQISKLPSMALQAFRLVWKSAPRQFVVSTILQLITGAGAGVVLLAGKDAFGAFLNADNLSRGVSSIFPQLLVVAGVVGLTQILQRIQSHQSAILSMEVSRRSMAEVLDVATAVDLEAFEGPGFYNRLQRAEGQAQTRPTQMVQGLIGLAGASVGIAAIGFALFKIQPILIPVVIAAWFPVWLANKQRVKSFYKFWLEDTQPSRERRYIQSVLTGRDEAKEVRAFGLGRNLKERFDGLQQEHNERRRKLQNRQLLLGTLATIGSLVVIAGVIVALIQFVLTGRMDLAAAGAAVAAVQMLGTRVQALLGSAEGLLETSLYLDDVRSFLDLRPQVEAARPTGNPPAGFQQISVKGVSFSYPGSKRRVLKDVSLDIKAGEIVALVGENGAGKTTLAKLLGNLYRPTQGTVAWDDEDISQFEPDGLREAVAVIFQDFVKYKLRARDNIGLGRHERSDDQNAVERSAAASGAHEFIQRLRDGYDTILSKEFKGGRDLSVGQWQKVALARAFFRDAPFIILDEPTAALDPRAERALFDSIRDLMRGRTVLLISHRFSSVRSADRILVLDKGELTEQGTHSELMALDGLYSELFTLQASQYLEDRQATA